MKVRDADTEIDGVRFFTQSLPPMRGYVLSPKLMRIVAPILVAGGRLDDIAVGDFAEGFLRYSDVERIQLALDILAGTSARGSDGQITELKSEKDLNVVLPEVTTLFKLLWWVVGFNFFPSGLAGLLEAAQKAGTASPSTSPT